MITPSVRCDRCGAIDRIAELIALVRELAAEAHRPAAGHRPGLWAACSHPLCIRAGDVLTMKGR